MSEMTDGDDLGMSLPGAVDLRRQDAIPVLSPLEEIALRGNMVVRRGDSLAAPDKLVPIGLYARYSTGKQKQKSIDRQTKIVAAYMLSLGYAIYVLYADPARSARSMHRESLQRLLADCRAGKIRIVMVEDFDRWSREIFDAVELCEELIDLNVEFHSAGDKKALSKKEVIEAAVKAEADRDRRNLIMSMGRFQHAADGGAHSGEFFGYRYGPEKGYLVPFPPEREVILAVFEMAAAGVSHRRIGIAMKARGAPGPTPNCRWTHGTVANILSQVAYTGRWYYPFTKTIFDRKTNTSKVVLRHPDEMTRQQFERLRLIPDDLFYAANARRRVLGPNPRGEAHFLEGKVRCDCPAVGQQTFHMSRKQLSCSHYSAGDACPGRSHSVMLATVEQAVLDAIGAKVRSTVGEQEFAASVDRSLQEAAARRRKARGEIEHEVEGIRGQFRLLLDEDMQDAYPRDILAEKQSELKARLADARARLEVLVELPEVLDAYERLRSLSDTLDSISDRLPFRAKTAGEAAVSRSLARLVRQVHVVRQGSPRGVMRLRIELDFVAFLRIGDGLPASAVATDVVEVEIEQAPGRHARYGENAAILRRTGAHRINDRRWAMVASRLPDVTQRHAEARHLSTRDVVDALLLRLRTGMPILSTASGDSAEMGRALTRFVYAAGDQILLDALAQKDPAFVAGLDLRPVEAARTRWKVGAEDWQARRGHAARLHALDGRTTLDDTQWAASEPLLHPCVEVSYKGTLGPNGRLLLEGLILALKTGLSWQRLPERFGDPRLFGNGVRRLVRSGSWDRLVAMWGEMFPDILDGLDGERMVKMRRGSPQWRGPSPKRSRYARSGGVAPAQARSRRERNAPRRRSRAD